MLKAIPMHWFYFIYAGASFGLGIVTHYYDVWTGRDTFVLRPQPDRSAVRELTRSR
jgi:hypothetical protein